MIKPYPYQEDAIEMAWDLSGFLLADEMGLGKTVVQMEELRRRSLELDNMRTLVVCPKSVISVWVDHGEMFGFKPQVHLPRNATGIPTGAMVITNWDQLRVNPVYKKYSWTYVVADEAHNAKNRKTKRTKALWTISSRYKRALTGTPIINRPDEIWAILHWLYPTEFRSYWKFFEEYVDYEKHPYHQYRIIKGAKNAEQLKHVLSKFMIRRTKKEVLTELPDKYYEKIVVDLTSTQRRQYEDMRKDALAWVGKNEDKPLAAKMVVAQLMRLRQMAAGTADVTYLEDGTLKVRIHEPSPKIDALMDLLEGTDKPVVVFTNFRGVVRMVEERCAKAGITCVSLTGTTPDKERAEHIERFQKGGARVFVGTIRAGGVGITLHRASTVVFLDRSWSPADNSQAEDRLHRIGQKNAVQVIHVDAARTVDQQVEAKLIWKWSFIKQILGG